MHSRGLRAISDFENELQMAYEQNIDADIETVFMMPSEEYSFITSSIIKEVASFGGSVQGLFLKRLQLPYKKNSKCERHSGMM